MCHGSLSTPYMACTSSNKWVRSSATGMSGLGLAMRFLGIEEGWKIGYTLGFASCRFVLDCVL